MHAIGEAAIDQALIAFESALNDFPRKDQRKVALSSTSRDNSTYASNFTSLVFSESHY
jgi:hypothetical protein